MIKPRIMDKKFPIFDSNDKHCMLRFYATPMWQLASLHKRDNRDRGL